MCVQAQFQVVEAIANYPVSSKVLKTRQKSKTIQVFQFLRSANMKGNNAVELSLYERV